MEEIFAKGEDLAAHVKEYADNRFASIKLTAAEKSSKIASNFIAIIIATVIFLFFLLFSGFALAYSLTKWTGGLSLSFLIVGGIYLLLGIVFLVTKEKLVRIPVMNSILKQLFKDEED